MRHRFVWIVVWERDNGDGGIRPLVRWVAVGLAALGIAVVIVLKVLT